MGARLLRRLAHRHGAARSGARRALVVAAEPHAEILRAAAAWTDLQLPPSGVAGPLLSPWQRWDALWYEHVARAGYGADDARLTFHPLYPALSRAVSVVAGGQAVLAELALSTAAFAVAVWALHRLAAHEARALAPHPLVAGAVLVTSICVQVALFS